MTIPNPEHLFEQAEWLATTGAGAPRQVDLRRALSSAYYALFHRILTASADLVVARHSALYALVYRSVDHRTLQKLCTEVIKPKPATNYAPYVPRSGFDVALKTFAGAALELQAKRHRADYDPASRFKARDVQIAITSARSGVQRFWQAPVAQRDTFLTLLLFPPRARD